MTKPRPSQVLLKWYFWKTPHAFRTISIKSLQSCARFIENFRLKRLLNGLWYCRSYTVNDFYYCILKRVLSIFFYEWNIMITKWVDLVHFRSKSVLKEIFPKKSYDYLILLYRGINTFGNLKLHVISIKYELRDTTFSACELQCQHCAQLNEQNCTCDCENGTSGHLCSGQLNRQISPNKLGLYM